MLDHLDVELQSGGKTDPEVISELIHEVMVLINNSTFSQTRKNYWGTVLGDIKKAVNSQKNSKVLGRALVDALNLSKPKGRPNNALELDFLVHTLIHHDISNGMAPGKAIAKFKGGPYSKLAKGTASENVSRIYKEQERRRTEISAVLARWARKFYWNI